MNKIYALKYSFITDGMVAVSELTSRVCLGGKKKLLAFIATLSLLPFISVSVHAAQLHIDNVWARDYLDLGQNKGAFKAGNTNVSIKQKDGSTFKFPDLPIPDFSAASNKGATTAIGGAYSVTATHYGTVHHAIATQQWGQSTYKFVDRATNGDFAATRLDKFVVESGGVNGSVDTSLTTAEALNRYGVDYNGKKQIIGFRVGSGSTSVVKGGGEYLFGQAYNPTLLSGSMFTLDWSTKQATENVYGFYNQAVQGDSGSGYYLYDSKKKEWVLLGTAYAVVYSGSAIISSIVEPYNKNTIDNLKNAYTQSFALNAGTFVYNSDSSYTLNGEVGAIEKITSKNQNKDLSFSGGGSINLKDNLNLGVGGLIFDDGNHYVINGDGKSFKGAGVDIGDKSVVEWNIKGESGDNLHKIGAGTLYVNTAQGNNLKIGDGTVVLNSEKTFNNIYIASGRGTVKINHDKALNSDNDFRGLFFTEKGGILDLNGYNQDFVRIAATDSGALITNTSDKTSGLSINNKSNYIYHGAVSGNTNISHSFDQKTANSRLVLDGNISANDINIKNSQLTMQGHATTHAIFRDGSIKCQIPGVPMSCDKDYAGYIQSQEKDVNEKNNSDYKSNNHVASFDQPDWDSRTFVFRNMNLKNADFSQGRNSAVIGDISASASAVTLGDAIVYIDMNDGSNITGDGFGFRQDVKEGTSSAPLSSSYDGFITLTDNSMLNIGNKFNGGVDAQDSSVNITSTDAVFSLVGSFVNSSLTLKEGAHASFENGLFSAGKIVTLEKGTVLNLTGSPQKNNGYAPVISRTDGFTLQGNASMASADQSILYGDITSDGASSIMLGNKDTSVTTISSALSSLLQGYNTAYSGAITASNGTMIMNNALWNVTGDSSTGTFSALDSKVSISPDAGFSTFTIGNLNASNTDFVLRTDLSHADKIAITQRASGQNNKVLVNFLKTPANGTLNIPLISAPQGTSKDIFTAGTQVEGFSQVTPLLKTTETDGKTLWNLTGFKTAPDKATISKVVSLTSGGYKNFMTELNNMNKRMGELRDTHGDAGAWARIMSGTGSADGGYSDNYTHVQVGFDKKHELDGLDLFTGVTMTYTDSNAGSDAFSGKTKSVGGGLYASALFNSGVYIDLIGKYVHHDNKYTARFAGLGEQDYTSHSWYAGAETGYRYHLTEDTFIEPQAELVYGAVSGKYLHWKDGNMDLAMANKDFNPLIGRTGIEFGKTFSGSDWSVTARAGTSWQFDLLANGETVLRDASGEKRIERERDSRMLFNVGLNSQIKDNVRFGLEFEKSAFGKYNVDNAINANFRYMF